MDTNEVEADARPPRSGLKFPGAVTTLAIVTVLVWVAALFIPSGRYLTRCRRFADSRHLRAGAVAAELRRDGASS